MLGVMVGWWEYAWGGGKQLVFSFLWNVLDLVYNARPDEKSVMTYVSCFYHALRGAQQVQRHRVPTPQTVVVDHPPPPTVMHENRRQLVRLRISKSFKNVFLFFNIPIPFFFQFLPFIHCLNNRLPDVLFLRACVCVIRLTVQLTLIFYMIWLFSCFLFANRHGRNFVLLRHGQFGVSGRTCGYDLCFVLLPCICWSSKGIENETKRNQS